QLVEVLGAMIVIQDLRSRGEKHPHPAPDPFGPVGHHTQSHLFLRNHTGGLDLRQGGKEVLVALDLVPTEEVDDPVLGDQIEPKPLGFAPLPLPAGTLGPHFLASRPAALRRLWPGRDVSPIDGQHHHWTPPPPLRHGRNLGSNLFPRWGDLQYPY